MIKKKAARPGKYETIKDRISVGEDATLKTITNLVAYKISQSQNDKGPEMNFITAESAVAQFVSERFASIKAFDKRLKELRNSEDDLHSFADNVYQHYCDSRPH